MLHVVEHNSWLARVWSLSGLRRAAMRAWITTSLLGLAGRRVAIAICTLFVYVFVICMCSQFGKAELEFVQTAHALSDLAVCKRCIHVPLYFFRTAMRPSRCQSQFAHTALSCSSMCRHMLAAFVVFTRWSQHVTVAFCCVAPGWESLSRFTLPRNTRELSCISSS